MEPKNSDQDTTPQLPLNDPSINPIQPQPQNVEPTTPAPITTPAQPAAPVTILEQQSTPTEHEENLGRIKRWSIQIMLAGLIGAAALAVVIVLVGSFNDVFMKAIMTLGLVMFHSLACLGFVQHTSRSNKSDFRFFENAVFFLVILSFFTSIFGTWGLLDGDIVGKLYGTYLVLLFASLHGQMLVDAREKEQTIFSVVNANYLFMGIVVLLIFPLIWFAESEFPGIYFRLLAACGIIDATLTIIAVILNRLYIQKHPETQSALFTTTTQYDANGNPVPVQIVTQKRRIHPLVLLLGIYIGFQIVASIGFGIVGGSFFR